MKLNKKRTAALAKVAAGNVTAWSGALGDNTERWLVGSGLIVAVPAGTATRRIYGEKVSIPVRTWVLTDAGRAEVNGS